MMKPGTFIFLFIFFWGESAYAQSEYKWYVSLYGGQASDNRLLDILQLERKSTDAYLCALAAGKPLTTFNDRLRLDMEGQIVKHFGDQSHMEFNGLVILRWLPFPWDTYLDTSFAIGDGLSYATAEPPLETADGEEETAHLLNYLMLELAAHWPENQSLEIFTRIHHRSGVYGLFGGVTEGSNFLTIGVRWYL